MPTILNPHDTERRDRGNRGTEDQDNGSGRRPPIDKHTGGGGSGDNENWDHRHQPRSRLTRFRMAVFAMLAGDLIFFGVIVVAFLSLRGNQNIDAHGNQVHLWHAIAIPRILWLNTAILLLSSATMEWARRHMFHEMDAMEEWFGLGHPTSNHTMPWLLTTIALGLLFVGGQAMAWHQIALQPAVLRDNPNTHFFYVITVVHAVHLLLGILALIAAAVNLRSSRQLESRQIFVDSVAWYWHSMGLYWIFLFILLRFFQ